MGRAALPLKPDVAQRTLKFLPLAAVITVAVVYGVSQLRSTPRTDCDKHRESDEEIRILDAKSSAVSKRVQ
ncbi:hypothetical protein COCOBI_07-0080 [Coccomyxa sp. Obi]|nr:hypothetical protein COCOBI_07-0080 [Coccomyxa sp. Obi]